MDRTNEGVNREKSDECGSAKPGQSYNKQLWTVGWSLSYISAAGGRGGGFVGE